MNLRPATIHDAQLLYDWRNDEETKAQSFNGGYIGWESHLTWFNIRLDDPNCLLYVGEEEGEPIGYIRADDWGEGSVELSYVIAPKHRGHRHGKRMVIAFVEKHLPHKRLVLRIKQGNTASEKIARALGLRPRHVRKLPGQIRPMVTWAQRDDYEQAKLRRS
jgi:RimJ/RimL family protein N-acetyltransferase